MNFEDFKVLEKIYNEPRFFLNPIGCFTYKTPIELVIKNDIVAINKVGDGIHVIGTVVKFRDGDKQKALTNDIDSDIDTSILICVLKHIAKLNGDKNGSHAMNRIMLAIKKKRDKLMTSNIDEAVDECVEGFIETGNEKSIKSALQFYNDGCEYGWD